MLVGTLSDLEINISLTPILSVPASTFISSSPASWSCLPLRLPHPLSQTLILRYPRRKGQEVHIILSRRFRSFWISLRF